MDNKRYLDIVKNALKSLEKLTSSRSRIVETGGKIEDKDVVIYDILGCGKLRITFEAATPYNSFERYDLYYLTKNGWAELKVLFDPNDNTIIVTPDGRYIHDYSPAGRLYNIDDIEKDINEVLEYYRKVSIFNETVGSLKEKKSELIKSNIISKELYSPCYVEKRSNFEAYLRNHKLDFDAMTEKEVKEAIEASKVRVA